jgi:nicotinate-nucleotide--dimethylbenzimidazole phosphoribosyltransferase
MSVNNSLIAATSNPLLEHALRDKLMRRGAVSDNLGELEPLAVKLGLMQNTLKPRLRDPQIVIFAADHGMAVDGIEATHRGSTVDQLNRLLSDRLPLAALARVQSMDLTVVDAGVADVVPAREHLLMRKIAHGTRNARVNPAMTIERAHAAIRAGMEIGDSLRGNVVAIAGLGVGGHESAALVLSRLGGCSLRELLLSHEGMDTDALAHLMVVAQGAHGRHRDITDPVEVLAAMGGFEIAMMAGLILTAASKRHLILIDGISACAALLVASRIAEPVIDYCVFCRSHSHQGLDRAMQLFGASAVLELGMDSTDGTSATLVWPLIKAAAALLTEVLDADDQAAAEEASRAGGDTVSASISSPGALDTAA